MSRVRRLLNLVLIFVVVLPIELTGSEREIDNSDAGVQWVRFDDIGAQFLIPVSWQHRFHQGKLMRSLVALSPMLAQDSDLTAQFSVNVVSNLTQINYRPVSVQIAQYATDLENNGFEVIESFPLKQGQYTGVSVLLRSFESAEVTSMIRRLYLANDKNDWLVVISFECPETHWHITQETRQYLFNEFVLQ